MKSRGAPSKPISQKVSLLEEEAVLKYTGEKGILL